MVGDFFVSFSPNGLRVPRTEGYSPECPKPPVTAKGGRIMMIITITPFRGRTGLVAGAAR
jgi:hypothetical protein